MTPKITVVTTFHRNDPYLSEAVESVLNQSFRDFEYLIIVDGNPEAASRVRERWSDPRIRVIETEKSGLIQSRNLGLRTGRGEWLAVVDSDDACEPERFEKQIQYVESRPNVVAVGCALSLIDSESKVFGTRPYPTAPREVRREMAIRNCLAHSAVLMNRKAALDAGGYRQEYLFAEDYDLWIRMGLKGDFANLPDCLVRYRMHAAAAKARLTRLQLRDTLRVRWAAVFRSGYPLSARFLWTFLASLALQALPANWIYRIFSLTYLKKSSRAMASQP